jgi:hypothetical protein
MTLRARPRLRRFVADHPLLYLPIRRRRAPGTVLSPNTDLVIEGFPRSANTWTEALVRVAGPSLHLAHHSHAAAHVKAAVQAKVPVLVLYRDPDEAVRSLLAMLGKRTSAVDAYADYASFYKSVLTLPRTSLFLVPFKQATGTPSVVIERLVQRFGLPLDASNVTREAVLAALEAKEAPLAEARRVLGQVFSDAAICAPQNAQRLTEQQRVQANVAIAAKRAQKLRVVARAVFEQLERAARG